MDRFQIMTNSRMNFSHLQAVITSNDFNGLYECIVTNDAGYDKESVEIKLKGKLYINSVAQCLTQLVSERNIYLTFLITSM